MTFEHSADLAADTRTHKLVLEVTVEPRGSSRRLFVSTSRTINDMDGIAKTYSLPELTVEGCEDTNLRESVRALLVASFFNEIQSMLAEVLPMRRQ